MTDARPRGTRGKRRTCPACSGTPDARPEKRDDGSSFARAAPAFAKPASVGAGRSEGKRQTTDDFRISDISGVVRHEARCYRVVNSVSAGGGFEKARQAWVGCGCTGHSAILMYAQAREIRRRLKIAAAFFRTEFDTLPGERW